MRKANVATCCGGLGACICTVSMLLPVIIGTAGAGATIMGSMSGMSGNAQSNGLWAMVNAINTVGQPLIIGSAGLILYGMRNFGMLPLTLAGVGGFLLYTSMYVLNMSILMVAISSATLAAAYVIAYGPLLMRSPKRK